MPKERPYEQLSYQGKWMRWKRNPDKFPHPCQTEEQVRVREQRREEQRARLIERNPQAYLSPVEMELLNKKKRCELCPNLLSVHSPETLCLTCQTYLSEAVNNPPRMVQCYHCFTVYSYRPACPDCGTPFNPVEQLLLKYRQEKGYLDIVKENAVKQGKDPKAAVRQVRNLHGLLHRFDSLGTLQTLSKYVRRREQEQTWQVPEDPEDTNASPEPEF